MESLSGFAPLLASETALKVTGRLGNSSAPDAGTPNPGRVSIGSCRSRFGVPLGVLLALSTRLCLEPDRGVTLLPRKADTGDANSSLSRELVAWAVRVDSGAVRRASGVESVAFGCWDAGDRPAILGVRGGGLFTARATAGCRWLTADGRSYGGILLAANGSDSGPGPGFTARNAGVAFWSRSCNA